MVSRKCAAQELIKPQAVLCFLCSRKTSTSMNANPPSCLFPGADFGVTDAPESGAKAQDVLHCAFKGFYPTWDLHRYQGNCGLGTRLPVFFHGGANTATWKKESGGNTVRELHRFPALPHLSRFLLRYFHGSGSSHP